MSQHRLELLFFEIRCNRMMIFMEFMSCESVSKRDARVSKRDARDTARLSSQSKSKSQRDAGGRRRQAGGRLRQAEAASLC